MNDNIDDLREQLLREFTRIRAAVLGYLRSIVRDPHLAEDIFQEIYIVIMRKASEFDPKRAPFKAWVRGIAYNLAQNALRKEKYIHLMPAPELMEAIHTAYENSDEEADAMSEKLHSLITCLKQIGKVSRDILDLRYRTGASLKTIAQKMGRSPGAVQVALSRIRASLLECIQKQDREVAHE
jgi:RNA polymerase sigma-70 factor (ECF subfamily)